VHRNGLRAALALEDGFVIEGRGFGSPGLVTGEVVFNTGMVGYTESITDPSYWGQILIQTYPLIGNYGVSRDHFQSDRPKIRGFVVHELCKYPSHWSCELTLDEWLRKEGVPGIEQVDTRMLTKRIRTKGTMLGALQVSYKPIDLDALKKIAKEAEDPNKRDLASEVSCSRDYWIGDGDLRVALIDCGVKNSIIKYLVEISHFRLHILPINSDIERILSGDIRGIVVSNGPGDPSVLKYLIRNVRKLDQMGYPLMGICLGLQIISLALGGLTHKLKFGHRGQNHPVKTVDGHAFITSQNHGYAVDESSIDSSELQVTMWNANDGTVEGIKDRNNRIYAVQFHPEASPGPLDTLHVFKIFRKIVEEADKIG